MSNYQLIWLIFFFLIKVEFCLVTNVHKVPRSLINLSSHVDVRIGESCNSSFYIYVYVFVTVFIIIFVLPILVTERRRKREKEKYKLSSFMRCCERILLNSLLFYFKVFSNSSFYVFLLFYVSRVLINYFSKFSIVLVYYSDILGLMKVVLKRKLLKFCC